MTYVQAADNKFNKSDKPPLEWEVFAFFKEGNRYLRVTRAKGTDMFSKQDGVLAHRDDTPTPFSRVKFRKKDDAPQAYRVDQDPRLEGEILAHLHEQANAAIESAIEKDGFAAREQERQRQRQMYKSHEAREPQRKGKTERDRERRRNKGS